MPPFVPTIVITGATSGIGQRAAIALARQGAHLVLTARSQARADATVAMKAVRGRASFLGDRSIGHMDPGARSSSLMIAAVCDVVGG